MVARRLSAFAILFLATTCLGGCLPFRVIWLPDSSGFIYMGERGHKVLRYDLARRGHRVLINLPSQETTLPGLSPDGSRIALVRIERTKERQTAQVIFINLDGEIIQESKVFPFGPGYKDLPARELRAAAAEWSPRGDHLLVADPDNSLAIYDVKNETFAVVSDVRATFLDYFYNGSIAGDGSGFLAARQSSKDDPDHPFAGIVFVDWEGWQYDLKMAPDTLDSLKRISAKEEFAKKKPDFWSEGTWEGHVVVHPWYRGFVRIDCAQRTITYLDDTRVADEFDRVKREGVRMITRLADGELVVQVRPMGQKTEQDVSMRIEVWIPKEGKRRTLIDNVYTAMIYTAPNGKAVAVEYYIKDEKDGKKHILVIGDQGRQLSNFDVD